MEQQQNQSAAPAAPPTVENQPAPLPPVAPAPPPTPAPAPPPVAPQPTPPPPAPPPVAPAQQKSGSPWPWIVGGCLMLVILIIGVIIFVGWWGIREAKKGINEQVSKFQPTVDNINKASEEAKEWQKESEEFRNSLPSPDELQKEMEKNYPAPK